MAVRPAPSLTLVFQVIAALQFIGGFVLCGELWPGDPEPGYQWKTAAYIGAITWLAAGVISGFLFLAVGEVLRYLRDIRDDVGSTPASSTEPLTERSVTILSLAE